MSKLSCELAEKMIEILRKNYSGYDDMSVKDFAEFEINISSFKNTMAFLVYNQMITPEDSNIIRKEYEKLGSENILPISIKKLFEEQFGVPADSYDILTQPGVDYNKELNKITKMLQNGVNKLSSKTSNKEMDDIDKTWNK